MKSGKRQLTRDDPHTPEQFAEYLQVSPTWVKKRINSLPGRIFESREVVRFIPSAYIAERLKRKP